MAKTERPAKHETRVSSQVQKDDVLGFFENIGDFLYLYEDHMRKQPLENWRTWPDTTIVQAWDIFKDSWDESKLDEMPADLIRSHRATYSFFETYDFEYGLADTDFRKLFMETKCELGFAIPLLIDLLIDQPLTDSDKLAFVYAWANCVRFMNKKSWIASKEAKKVEEQHDPRNFEFEIECTLDQAALLERYMQVKVRAYNMWHGYTINRFPKQKNMTAPLPASEVVTGFRSDEQKLGLKIPRSLISRAMSHCAADWQKWSDVTKKKGDRPDKLNASSANSFSVSNSGFKFANACTALSIGDAKKMHVSKIIRGELDVTRVAKYLIVTKKDGLIYTVRGKYKL